MEAQEFAGHLTPFLHEKTAHFVHELATYARCPYDMIAYDRKVKYDFPGGDRWDPEANQVIPPSSHDPSRPGVDGGRVCVPTWVCGHVCVCVCGCVCICVCVRACTYMGVWMCVWCVCVDACGRVHGCVCVLCCIHMYVVFCLGRDAEPTYWRIPSFGVDNGLVNRRPSVF